MRYCDLLAGFGKQNYSKLYISFGNIELTFLYLYVKQVMRKMMLMPC